MFKAERKVDRLNRVHGITTSRGPTVSITKTNGDGWWNTVALNHEYFTPIILFAVLFAVLWLTDHKLGWFSFMIRDGWTFTAFVVTYVAFAPAFLQEKDKTKKTPLFKKAMVFTTIIAVDFALIGMTPASIFNWSWNEPSPQPTAQVTPPPVRTVETIVVNSDNFTYKSIPDGVSIDFDCPNDAFMDFTYHGMPEKEKGFIDCDIGGRNIVLGAHKAGRRVGLMLKDGPPRSVPIMMGTD